MKSWTEKYVCGGLFLLGMFPLSVCGQTVGKAHLSGSLKGFAGQPVVVCERTADAVEPDTLQVSEKGTFKIDYAIAEPENAYLRVNAGAEDHSFCLYLRPGASLVVDVKADASGVNATFGGDTGHQSAYADLRRSRMLMDVFTEEHWLKLPDFKACKHYIATQQQTVKDVLGKVPDSLFMAKEMDGLQREALDYCFSYASAKEKNGYKMEEDAAFMDFVKQVDVNDTLQINLISSYLDWYMLAHPQKGELPEPAAKLYCAKALIANQDVLNRLADNALSLIALVGMFGGDASAIAYPIYQAVLAVSTDKGVCESVRNTCRVMENQQPGANPVDLKMMDAQGRFCNLKEVVGNGKYTYIDFWATWCAPCCKEIPYLEELSTRYKESESLRFVSISLDENKEAWLKKLSADKPGWQQYNIPKAEQEACAKLYGISGIPRFMLFDKEGKMMNASATRPSEQETQALLDKLANE